MDEYLSESQLSRLADLPLSKIRRLALSGELQPVAMSRCGKKVSRLYDLASLKKLRFLVDNKPQPIL